MFWEKIWEVMTVTPLWELLLIFSAKIVEVSIGTLRSILIVKGYRPLAVALALVEITLWVFVASRVITGIAESPMKGIAYGFGFAAGVYFGSLLEQKMAFGKVLIQVITETDKGILLAETLRDMDCGVTSADAQGKVEARKILMIVANRRGSGDIVKKILELDPGAMIVRNDVSSIVGGHIPSGKSLLK
ncbi:MAG TPA: DUF5698 domain-containing protein [Candidatus Izemoplasmatales bacterium]|nr:DUF5698 domain-containing protein [Bacillota bacterium]HRY77368.1 DUF5698 domain-containing protein [Candidatus Izemoplasmatales bacterium]